MGREHDEYDHVYCCNCNEEQLVKLGEDVCPRCKMEGSLAWADEIEIEIKITGER